MICRAHNRINCDQCRDPGYRAVELCTTASHEAIKATGHTFAVATKYVGTTDDGIILGNCLACGSTLGFETGPDEDTEPMANAIARRL